MNKNLKIILGVIYLICLSLILFAFFKFVDVTQITDYSYIRDNTKVLIGLKNQNIAFFAIIFLIFCIIWILLLGFGSPIALISGFIFGKITGTLITVFGFTIGATLLYFLSQLYLKETILNYLPKKAIKLKNIFNKNEFFYFMVFRFTGGLGIPFGIQNVLPVLFDMKIKNYFFSTFIGLVPTVFIINSLGEGIEKIIETKYEPSLFDIITDPNIYLPLSAFGAVILISFFIKNKIFK
tara:strand:+ start:76 stop:789 length:714 start_codon:yes stop_codon:yes gene_type:complete